MTLIEMVTYRSRYSNNSHQFFHVSILLGAIWGSSEALTLRYHETQEFWRHTATIIGIIFLIRFFLQIRDFVQDRTPSGSMPVRLIQIFSAKFVLEGECSLWMLTKLRK